MSTYHITFENVLRCWGKAGVCLCFPGRYGLRHGPYENRQQAWEQYVRIAREIYFAFEPEKPTLYTENPIPPYVPPTNYEI